MPKRRENSAPAATGRTDNRSLRKGQTVTIKIASLAPGGEGVSRDMGIPIFVNRTAPGDQVEVRLFDVRKDFAKAEVVSLITPSPSRAEPPCKLFKVCGGCQWQHIEYGEQIKYKQDIVRQAIHHIGRLSPDLVLPTIGADPNLYYRNKVQFPVGQVRSTGRIVAGYFAQNSHELVNVKHCPVQPEPLDQVLAIVKELMEKERLSAYDEETHNGLIRHIVERFSFGFDKVLLTLVVNSEPKLAPELRKKLEVLASEVMERAPEIIGVCINFNPSRGNRIMGDTTSCLRGEPYLMERLRSHLAEAPAVLREGLKFRLSSTSFFQVNTRQAEVLLDQVLLACVGAENGTPIGAKFEHKVPLLIDAYAGVGTMAAWLSPIAEKVLAIESAESSVIDGQINLGLNNLNNVEFRMAKVEDEVFQLLKNGIKPDLIVVDPPRKGIELNGLLALTKLGAARIVYVSCNPATLARDLKIFRENGYEPKRVQPIDMFPQTFHVESVTILDRTGS